MASTRLNLQHHLWVSSLGYLLHPSIPMKYHLRIAEVGCGTGLLALDIARTLPRNINIEATDQSLSQCPPEGFWPMNVTFKQLDIFDPIPEHLVGRYDVVCIRHFICVIQSGDPNTLLSQLLKLIKSGGYLQWQEFDLSTNTIRLADPSMKAPKLQTYMESIKGPENLQGQVSWVKTFHTRFGKDGDIAGAELVAHDRVFTAKEAMMVKLEVNYLSTKEWCENLRARDPESEDLKRLERLAKEADEECLENGRGSLIDTEMVTWVVRKR